MIVGAIAACQPVADPFPGAIQGASLDPGPKPPAVECERMIRSETVAAGRIRAALYGQEYPDPEQPANELRSDPITVLAAATDPASRIHPEIGIPLTPAEEVVLEESGASFGGGPLSPWAHDGAPDRFGGFWFEPPPNQGHVVVAIVGGDPATIALARCLDGWYGHLSYVNAALSLTQLAAARDRVRGDLAVLEAAGIKVAGLGYREDEGKVVIGITGLTDAIASLITVRYGGLVRAEEMGPAALW